MKKLVPFVFAAMLIACADPAQPEANADTLPAFDRSATEAAVRQTLDAYFAAIKAKGLHGEFGYLDSSADFTWVPPGYASPISYDSVAAILRKRAPEFAAIANSWDTLSIIPLSPTLASYTGRLTSTMTDTAGKTATYRLTETGVVVKRGEKWLLLNGQTSVVGRQ